jgi:hypothetical protein
LTVSTREGNMALFSKIISGGQTGVDRAALDVALATRLPCGGWCPKGRRAEYGSIPAHYPLTETPWDGYPQRTEWNVRDSDGTLILTCGHADRGTALTITLAQRYGKPLVQVDLTTQPKPDSVRIWAETHQVRVLNVAGPRESESPGIYTRAVEFLTQAMA